MIGGHTVAAALSLGSIVILQLVYQTFGQDYQWLQDALVTALSQNAPGFTFQAPLSMLIQGIVLSFVEDGAAEQMTYLLAFHVLQAAIYSAATFMVLPSAIKHVMPSWDEIEPGYARYPPFFSL